MPRFTTDLHVWLDNTPDDDPYEIRTDGRDLAKWEVQTFRDETRATLRARFVAWSAMRRAGLYGKSFEQFNMTDCVSVENVPVEESEGEQGLDPGTPSTSATS